MGQESVSDLEIFLVSADVGVDTTVKFIDGIERRVAKDKYINTTDLNKILKKKFNLFLLIHARPFLRKL